MSVIDNGVTARSFRTQELVCIRLFSGVQNDAAHPENVRLDV